MDLSIEMITPKMAEKYLQFNTCNRHLRKSLVSQYARDMTNGNWKLTHQGVAFNCDGTLLDGQHRLAAIIESGVAVQMLVARGVESKNQLFMDDHANRTAGDALTLARGERVSTTDVAIVRVAVELQIKFSCRHTKSDLNELISKFHGALDFCREFYGLPKQRGVTAAPVWGSIALAWFYVDDLDRLRSFCRMLSGVDMVTDEADRSVQILREWLLRTGVKSGPQRLEAFQKTQRSIVAFMKHQKLEKLYGTSTYYPWPLINPVRTSS